MKVIYNEFVYLKNTERNKLMKWFAIALVIYIFINGFIEEAKKRLSGYSDDYYEEDDYNDNDDWNNNYSCNQQSYDSPQFDNGFISRTQPPEYHHKDTNEYRMLVRVRGNKYARQEEIVIKAHNRAEAKQKAVNMGYDIIRCN